MPYSPSQGKEEKGRGREGGREREGERERERERELQETRKKLCIIPIGIIQLKYCTTTHNVVVMFYTVITCNVAAYPGITNVSCMASKELFLTPSCSLRRVGDADVQEVICKLELLVCKL